MHEMPHFRFAGTLDSLDLPHQSAIAAIYNNVVAVGLCFTLAKSRKPDGTKLIAFRWWVAGRVLRETTCEHLAYLLAEHTCGVTIVKYAPLPARGFIDVSIASAPS
jgi:hypothetical protein